MLSRAASELGLVNQPQHVYSWRSAARRHEQCDERRECERREHAGEQRGAYGREVVIEIPQRVAMAAGTA
jgi:hypothetical protein